MFEVESSEGFHKFLSVQYPGTLFREVQGCTNPILFTADHIQIIRNLKGLHNARWLCWSSCLVHAVQFQHFQNILCSESRIMNIKTCQHHCKQNGDINIFLLNCVTLLLRRKAHYPLRCLEGKVHECHEKGDLMGLQTSAGNSGSGP